MKKVLIVLGILMLLLAAGGAYLFLFRADLGERIVIPYIAHQKPRIDPHLPGYVALDNNLDEILFDGLFNVSANPSGIVYEDGLGEFMGLSPAGVVSVRLTPGRTWHSSYHLGVEKNAPVIHQASSSAVAVADIRFTLRRIESLGSRSPDYILLTQALDEFVFDGPDDNNEIHFRFRRGREWTETDIKEVLSFKVLPATSEMNAAAYTVGSGPYMLAGEADEIMYFAANPQGKATIPRLDLMPYIDNSTFTTELRNRRINTLLTTPFGARSPILADTSRYFNKSNIATTFFALFFNFERLSREQRTQLRALIDNRTLLAWFFRTGTPQQRHIVDYRGGEDNYHELLNYSIFPSTSYYVDEKVVIPLRERAQPDLSLLPDTIRIQTSINYGFREELSELVEIFNDPTVLGRHVQVSAVSNDEIRQGNYDAVLVPISGYRSNFLFDLYSIFLREPDFSAQRINLVTSRDRRGEESIDPSSFTASRNFFRLDPSTCDPADRGDVMQLLEYLYGFMSTRQVGDKQAYAQFIDELDQDLACGAWLFSLPSLATFSTQFDERTITLYGVASQLSTIEQWRERIRTGLARFL